MEWQTEQCKQEYSVLLSIPLQPRLHRAVSSEMGCAGFSLTEVLSVSVEKQSTRSYVCTLQWDSPENVFFPTGI